MRKLSGTSVARGDHLGVILVRSRRSRSATAMRDRIAQLEDRIAAIEARFGPRDRAVAAVIAAIAPAIGSVPFTSRQVIALARTDCLMPLDNGRSPLPAALEAADIVTAYELGALLRRVNGSAIGELRVEW